MMQYNIILSLQSHALLVVLFTHSIKIYHVTRVPIETLSYNAVAACDLILSALRASNSALPASAARSGSPSGLGLLSALRASVACQLSNRVFAARAYRVCQKSDTPVNYVNIALYRVAQKKRPEHSQVLYSVLLTDF